jgi:hypothetical protein
VARVDRRLRARLRANGLEPRLGGVAEVVRRVCGIQAQDAAAARLSVRARSTGLTAGDVDAEPAVVRTWAWRGTLHLVARDDLPWVLALVAPGAMRSVAARWRALGLDDAAYARARDAIRERLAAGPVTRAQLRDALSAAGVDASGQRLPHLARRAAFDGLLHHPLDGTFAALEPPAATPAREDALAELGRRHAAAYGPADPRDLAAWSGLPAAEARAAWSAGDDTVHVDADGGGPPVVRLLPAFDTYLLGHRDRGAVVAAEHARLVHPGGGWLHPVVLVDGRAAATWRLDGQAVAVRPFAALPDAVRDGLEAETADVGRFLGLAGAHLRVEA